MTEDINDNNDSASAAQAYKDSVSLITKHIGNVSIIQVKEKFFDPFALGVKSELAEMREELTQAKGAFNQNVLDAVRASRREILEERIKEFNTDEIIQKLSEIPGAIAAQTRNLQSAMEARGILKKAYEAAMIKLTSSAAIGGLQPQIAADTTAIAKLLGDAVENIDKYGVSVNIECQSVGKERIQLGVKDLNITEARSAYSGFTVAERNVTEAQIALGELDNSFSALKRIAHIITAVSR